MSSMSPAAELVLDVGISRALGLIQCGLFDDARRALIVACDAANLVDVAERARIVRSDDR